MINEFQTDEKKRMPVLETMTRFGHPSKRQYQSSYLHVLLQSYFLSVAWFIAHCQAITAFCATCSQHFAAIFCRHASAEAVLAAAFDFAGLKCPFHDACIKNVKRDEKACLILLKDYKYTFFFITDEEKNAKTILYCPTSPLYAAASISPSISARLASCTFTIQPSP